MKLWRPGGAWLVVWGAACAPPPPAAPAALAERARPVQGARAAQPRAEATSIASVAGPSPAETAPALPPGVVMSAGDANQPPTVDPAPLDLASLPLATLPEPLRHEKPPTSLPTGGASTALRIEPVESRTRWRDPLQSAVYVVLDAKLGRLQMGVVARDPNIGDRVYRTCGEKYYPRPILTPARWETLSWKAGVAEYQVVDAWFDDQSCEAVVVRETVVHPAPVLGGLMFAYRSHCEECVPRDTVTFLAPPLTQPVASGLGGTAIASNGKFTIIELPLARGGAATFAGTAMMHSFRDWPDASRWTTLHADALIGIEITQTVPERAPNAIAFASLRSR